MNSPFVVEQAKRLANRALSPPPPGDGPGARGDGEKRITYLYRLLYGRLPKPDEIALAERFIAASPTQDGESKLTPWERYVQVLLLANDFGFVD
jgi:hypothetical protein